MAPLSPLLRVFFLVYVLEFSHSLSFIIIVGFEQLDKRHCSPLFCSSFFEQFFFFWAASSVWRVIHTFAATENTTLRRSCSFILCPSNQSLTAVYLSLKPSVIFFFARFNDVPCLVICAGTVWCSLLVIQCNSSRRGKLEWYPQCASSCSNPFFIALKTDLDICSSIVSVVTVVSCPNVRLILHATCTRKETFFST